MNNQFKAGDLAIITNCWFPENIGRVVELSFIAPAGCRYVSPEGFVNYNTSGVDVWVVTAQGIYTSDHQRGKTNAGWTQKAERNLMPLRGNFAPDLQKSHEVSA
jgi:hypothetical protein